MGIYEGRFKLNLLELQHVAVSKPLHEYLASGGEFPPCSSSAPSSLLLKLLFWTGL